MSLHPSGNTLEFAVSDSVAVAAVLTVIVVPVIDNVTASNAVPAVHEHTST